MNTAKHVSHELDALGRAIETIHMPHEVKVVVMSAYGLLWNVEYPAPQASAARKLLLALLTKAEQEIALTITRETLGEPATEDVAGAVH